MNSADTREIERTPASDLHHDRTVRQGIWIFLASEIMLFGGLFLSYALYRFYYPEAFAEGSRTMNFVAGTVNTAILLFSSYLVAQAEHHLEENRLRGFRFCLAGAALLGLIFLGVKAYEYYEKIRHHHVPGPHFNLEEWSDPLQVQQFFFLYFLGTGLHALHVLIGVFWMTVVLIWNRVSRPGTESVAGKVRFTALYWHFVDIVWIFLYPFFYLAG